MAKATAPKSRAEMIPDIATEFTGLRQSGSKVVATTETTFKDGSRVYDRLTLSLGSESLPFRAGFSLQVLTLDAVRMTPDGTVTGRATAKVIAGVPETVSQNGNIGKLVEQETESTGKSGYYLGNSFVFVTIGGTRIESLSVNGKYILIKGNSLRVPEGAEDVYGFAGLRASAAHA